MRLHYNNCLINILLEIRLYICISLESYYPFFFPCQGKAYPMLLICLFSSMVFSPVLGVPLVGVVPCDHVALGKKILGYCINRDTPNGLCCMAVANAVERFSNHRPCFCDVIKQDVAYNAITAKRIIQFYYSCGGKYAEVTRLNNTCRGICSLSLLQDGPNSSMLD